MRVLPRKLLFSSRSSCHRRPSRARSPDLLEQEDAQQASPCQCLVPDAIGVSALNGDAKGEVVERRRSTDDPNPNGNIGDSEAEETSSSDETTSENGCCEEGGGAADGICESRRRVEDMDRIGKDAHNATRDGVGAADKNSSPAFGATAEEDDGQTRPRDPIRSSLRRSSDSAPQLPKKVNWTENLAVVHEYELNNDPRELWDDVPTKCVCIIL